MKNETVNLTPDQLELVKAILKKQVPDCEVRVFGSRLTGQIKKYSDLDLALVGKEKINRQVLIRLKEDFEASSLPFRVDLLDWHRITKEFQVVIEKNYLILR